MQKKPSKLTVISLLSSVAAAPAIVFLCIKLIEGKSYYAAAVLVIACAVLPFFVYFENPLLWEGFQRASSYGQEKNPSRTMKSGLVNRLRTKGAPNG